MVRWLDEAIRQRRESSLCRDLPKHYERDGYKSGAALHLDRILRDARDRLLLYPVFACFGSKVKQRFNVEVSS